MTDQMLNDKILSYQIKYNVDTNTITMIMPTSGEKRHIALNAFNPDYLAMTTLDASWLTESRNSILRKLINLTKSEKS